MSMTKAEFRAMLHDYTLAAVKFTKLKDDGAPVWQQEEAAAEAHHRSEKLWEAMTSAG